MIKKERPNTKCYVVEVRPDCFERIQSIARKHDLKKRKLVSDLIEEGLKNFALK